MNVNLSFVLGIMSLTGTLPAFPETVGNPVVVSATIEQAKFCLGNPGSLLVDRLSEDAVALRLRVWLSYRNVGSKSLILPTYHELSALIVSVGRLPLAGESGQNQLVTHFKRRQKPTDELPKDVSADSPFNPLFKVVPPNEELNKYFSESVVLPVHNSVASDLRSDLLGRKIYIQLELTHMGLSRRLESKLAARWERYGRLWRGRVRSNPIEIDVPKSPQIVDCSHEAIL
jgi:hypothetical protein